MRSFFLNVTYTTELYTLSLHDALPIYAFHLPGAAGVGAGARLGVQAGRTRCSLHSVHRASEGFTGGCPLTFGVSCRQYRDRKSTRLNSSHPSISYAVFCLKKKTLNYFV